MEAFNRQHKSVRLTVGARALCKHAVRCHWWGTPTVCFFPKNVGTWALTLLQGSEGNKNKIANEKIEEVIDAAVWINSFMLPVSDCFAMPMPVMRAHRRPARRGGV